MTEKKGTDDLDDLDWGSAIAEWEEHTFDPNVAKDKVTNKPAELAGAGPKAPKAPASAPTPDVPIAASPSRPGLTPPAGPVAPRPMPPKPGIPRPGEAAAKPLYRPPAGPAAAPLPPPKGPPQLEEAFGSGYDDDDDDDDDGNRTVVARIPQELLKNIRGDLGGPKPSGGGLGQLFGAPRAGAAAGPVTPTPAPPPVAAPSSRGADDDIDVVLDDLLENETPSPVRAGVPTPSTPQKALARASSRMRAVAHDGDAVVTTATLDDDEADALGLLDELDSLEGASLEKATVAPPDSPRTASAEAERTTAAPPPGALADALAMPEMPKAAPLPRGTEPFGAAPSAPGSRSLIAGPPRAELGRAAAREPAPRGGAVDIFTAEEGTAPRLGREPVAPADDSDAGAVSSLDRERTPLEGGIERRGRPSSVPPLALGPSLLAPDQRQYDPNEETGIIPIGAVRDAIASATNLSVAGLTAAAAGASSPLGMPAAAASPGSIAEPLPSSDGDVPTDLRRHAELRIPITTKTGYAWENEHPAPTWLDVSTMEALTDRAAWLEDEARRETDRSQMARRLLAVSEMRALLGDTEGALALAMEARDLAPTVALAHRQARALMPMPRQAKDVVAALDLETKTSTPAAKVHCALLAADALRIDGDDEGAMKRWEQASRAVAGDIRGPLSRAARALSRGELSHAALRVPEQGELEGLGKALGAVLRLRGVERKGPAVEDAASANEAFLKVRAALDKGDGPRAAGLLEGLRKVPELLGPASWLSAALAAPRAASRPDTLAWLGPLARGGDVDAMRAYAERAVELGLSEALDEASRFEGLGDDERAVLATLAGDPATPPLESLTRLEHDPGLRSLAAALSGFVPAPADHDDAVRAHARRHGERTVGSPLTRARTRFARLLAAGAPFLELEATASALLGDGDGQDADALLLELAMHLERHVDVADRIAHWPEVASDGTAMRDRFFAAALVAEQAGHREQAIAALRGATASDPKSRTARRVLASLDDRADWTAELVGLADALGSGDEASVARLEAIARSREASAAEQLELADAAHAAAPGLAVGAFVGEVLARKVGDEGVVLRWLDERLGIAIGDPIERGLVAAAAAELGASEVGGEPVAKLLREALAARPTDGSLLELYERVSPASAKERAALRVDVAAASQGAAKAQLLLEAALLEERAGDGEAALRLADAAAAEAPLAAALRERLELSTGHVARLADDLLARAKNEPTKDGRREAYVRLADVDRIGRNDPASALLWHRTVLEEEPASLPSLRYVEHALIGEGRGAELETVAATLATALRDTDASEALAHGDLAVRLRMKGSAGDWDGTREMADLMGGLPGAPLSALRLRQAHARARGDERAFLSATGELIQRAQRPSEEAILALRAGEAAARLGELDRATELLRRAAAADPGDVVVWGMLADVRQRAGDTRGAADACESLARASVVRDHKLLAFYDAGRMWVDEVGDLERGIGALEEVAAIDIRFQDTFPRLSALYAQQGSAAELARLLERQLDVLTDMDERVDMQVERARMLLRVGDVSSARVALEAALEDQPDHLAALAAFADLANLQKDWTAAEQSWIRLAVLRTSPTEQREVYLRLGELYAGPLGNLERAEGSFREVLKRTPDDTATMDRLVTIYKKLSDTARAVEVLGELVNRAPDPIARRDRVIELANVLEGAGEIRRAEQALDHARKELPGDVLALRALAEFHVRHNQRPAVQVLLDRAAADTRRAFAAGRFSPALFEMLGTCFELRGKRDAASVVVATLAAFEGRVHTLRGAEARAADKKLDDLLAPELLSPALRALLQRTGDALDAAAPFDARTAGAAPLPGGSKLGSFVTQLALAFGIQGIQIVVSPKLGYGCLPVSSTPPVMAMGDKLLSHPNELAREFLIMRALKVMQAKGSALVRTPLADVPVLVASWLKAFHTTWAPPGVPAPAVAEMTRRISAALPDTTDQELGSIALELVGVLGNQLSALTPALLGWANRVGLLAVGDPSAALEGLAWMEGREQAPPSPAERGAWILKTPEAREVLVFGVADAYGEARSRMGIAAKPAPSVSLPDIPAPPPLIRR